ncbi:hypothetical protein [Bradyrhizobium sp.]|jgi:hypothetical protein|uniref:hypothetical protein n=1 Tax=Bradyrhizobium sp. TaxID=376 RepID=UPI003C20620B
MLPEKGFNVTFYSALVRQKRAGFFRLLAFTQNPASFCVSKVQIAQLRNGFCMPLRLLILCWIGTVSDRAENTLRFFPGNQQVSKASHACQA